MPTLKKSAPKSAKKKRMGDEMAKFKAGTLHSGSKTGPRVTDRKQAVAIGMSESGQGKKVASPENKRAMADKGRKKRKSRNGSRT